ncbi:unnamed protein product [Phytophthora fragariaefolia]|uniref:Unnamed protein product n=1 Tax=Phytophthora fragariaefolia TaxID=1490495 RepID=A0A9W6Y8T9_9STRA|nr:unnamed protein product [Phytophthora fragariaefolia]
MSAPGSPTSSAPSPAVIDLAASAASPRTSRSTEAAPPVAPVAPALRVKLEGSGTASASSTTAPHLPSVSRSSATSALTLADLERVLELRDNRLEFAQAERDVKLGKLVSYAVAKPFPEPSHELFRQLQGSSSIDELVAALEKEIVGGPHPAAVAGEPQADAFAARARADLLEHELRETMKRVSQLEESEKTASALVRSPKEQLAQLENRNISLQELHQSTNLERDSWSTERIRLDATIRDKERIIASMTADYHRDAGNRQLVSGRCYELTAQQSDAVAMGNTSAHQLLKRQLADKDDEIRRLLRTIRMSPVVSEFQRRIPFLVVAAMLDKLVSLTAAELSAFRSASETLRQTGLGIFGDRGGQNPPPVTPAAPVTPALPAPRRLQVSPTSQASSRLPRSSSDDFGRRHARSPSVSRSSARPRSLSVSARGSQSAPSSPARNAIVRRPPSPSVARSGGKRRHSPDSDADSSGSALVSGHASSRSSTSSRSRKKARATPTTSPVSSKKSSSRRSTNKKAAKSRATVSYSPSEDSDGEDGLAPLHRPRRTAAANCSAIQRVLHARESESDSEVLGEAAAVSSSSGHGRQASSGSTTVSSTSAPPPSSQVTSPSPTQAPPGLIADLASASASASSSALAEYLEGADSSGVESLSDDSVLEVCPPVEKEKRSKKPGSLLEVLSHEWCKSRGVVREDILLALWERMHWFVESSVNVWLAETFLACERTSRIDYEFTALWKSLKDYLLGRKQRSDLLRLTVKVLGDAVVGAANHKFDGLPAPLVDTEVCFDSAIPFYPPAYLPWFPRTADWIAEAVRIDNHEPWRLCWLTTPGRHPYNTIFRLYYPEFPLFVPEGADSEMVAACVEDERLIAEPEPPALHPNTPVPVNRPDEIEFCPPNIVHSALGFVRRPSCWVFRRTSRYRLLTVLVGGFFYIVVSILPLQFLQLISN